MTLMLCSCTKKTEPEAASQTQAAADAGSNAEQKTTNYTFTAGDVTISMNQDTAEFLEKLGDPLNYAESPSCAFEGIDKIYSYEGWDLYTYPDGDKDRVNSVYFTDDSVSTPEGIKIGSTVEEVLTAYPGEHTEKFDVYTYTDGKTELAIMTTDGKVDAIEYRAVLEN